MTNLTSLQCDEVLAPSKKYAEAEYQAIISGLLKTKKVPGRGHIELSFPGVKPQHVAHMLKKLVGDDDTLTVQIHAEHGVCLIRQQPATEAASTEAAAA